MRKRSRRTHSPAFNAKVALAALKGRRSPTLPSNLMSIPIRSRCGAASAGWRGRGFWTARRARQNRISPEGLAYRARLFARRFARCRARNRRFGNGRCPRVGAIDKEALGLVPTMPCTPTRPQSSRFTTSVERSRCGRSRCGATATGRRSAGNREPCRRHAREFLAARASDGARHCFSRRNRRHLPKSAVRTRCGLVSRHHSPDLADRSGQSSIRRSTSRQRRAPRTHRRGNR